MEEKKWVMKKGDFGLQNSSHDWRQFVHKDYSAQLKFSNKGPYWFSRAKAFNYLYC